MEKDAVLTVHLNRHCSLSIMAVYHAHLHYTQRNLATGKKKASGLLASLQFTLDTLVPHAADDGGSGFKASGAT